MGISYTIVEEVDTISSRREGGRERGGGEGEGDAGGGVHDGELEDFSLELVGELLEEPKAHSLYQYTIT